MSSNPYTEFVGRQGGIVKKDSYPNLDKMLQLALTLPVGSATSEGSFFWSGENSELAAVNDGKNKIFIIFLYIEGKTAKLSPKYECKKGVYFLYGHWLFYVYTEYFTSLL